MAKSLAVECKVVEGSQSPAVAPGSNAHLSLLVLFLFLSTPLLACYQSGESPFKLYNNDVKVLFTFDEKPMRDAVVTLWSKQKGSIARKQLGENGWVVFPKIPPGEYRVQFDGPSHEGIEIVLSPPLPIRTAMHVNFYDDYCHLRTELPDRN